MALSFILRLQRFNEVKATYGRDCDGNIFEIQEIIDQNHPAKVFLNGLDFKNTLKF